MNLKSLRAFFTVALVAAAGQSWAAPSLPADGNPAWQDIPDHGIQWSVNGGAWSDVGSTALYVNDSVQFRVTMHKQLDGNHYLDLVKAWIDWDNSNTYNNAVGSSEILLAGNRLLNSSHPHRTDSIVDQSFYFLSGSMTVNAGMLGDHYLLARVVCSDTLLSTAERDNGNVNLTNQWGQSDNYGGYDEQWNYSSADMEKWFSPTANYAYSGGQGDSEQLMFTVKNRVPEPGTLALLAVAMLGMGLNRKLAKRV